MIGIDPNFFAKKQKRRPIDDERKKALNEEVKCLKENQFIREAYYSKWIENPVLVPKPNEIGRLPTIFRT